jgi:hypothetical protein
MVRALDKCRAKRRAVVECLRRGRDEARLAEVGKAHASSTSFLFPLSRLLRVLGGGERFQRGVLGLIAEVIRRSSSLEAQAAAAYPGACLSPHSGPTNHPPLCTLQPAVLPPPFPPVCRVPRVTTMLCCCSNLSRHAALHTRSRASILHMILSGDTAAIPGWGQA